MAEPPSVIRILIVEDDPHNLTVLRAAIETGAKGQPIQISTAGTLQDALAEASTADVVFLDLSLPDADPDETIAAVSAQSRAALLVVSGVSDPQIIWRAGYDGASDYLLKPFERSQVIASMTCALGRVAAAQERRRQQHQRLAACIADLEALRSA